MIGCNGYIVYTIGTAHHFNAYTKTSQGRVSFACGQLAHNLIVRSVFFGNVNNVFYWAVACTRQ